MEQLPHNELQTFADFGPDDFMEKVLSYWKSRGALLDNIPNPETRGIVTALIDGRVIERINNNFPPSMSREISFSDFDDTLLAFRLTRSNLPDWTDRFLREAIPYVGIVYYRYMKSLGIKDLLEIWDDRDKVVTTVLGAAAPWLAVQGLSVAGFTATGVTAGSLAALWQSTIGNAVAGSLFSTFQSVGALGALSGPWSMIAGAAGAGIYGAYRLATQPNSEERFNEMVLALFQDDDKRNDFWASILV